MDRRGSTLGRDAGPLCAQHLRSLRSVPCLHSRRWVVAIHAFTPDVRQQAGPHCLEQHPPFVKALMHHHCHEHSGMKTIFPSVNAPTCAPTWDTAEGRCRAAVRKSSSRSSRMRCSGSATSLNSVMCVRKTSAPHGRGSALDPGVVVIPGRIFSVGRFDEVTTTAEVDPISKAQGSNSRQRHSTRLQLRWTEGQAESARRNAQGMAMVQRPIMATRCWQSGRDTDIAWAARHPASVNWWACGRLQVWLHCGAPAQLSCCGGRLRTACYKSMGLTMRTMSRETPNMPPRILRASHHLS